MSDTTAGEQVICACYDVTLEQIREKVKAEPSTTFDDLMASTGAGTKCTACLLDLEYFFVSGEVPRDKTRMRKPAPKRSFKRRVYDAIDSFSPVRPRVTRTFAPIISGVGIEEYLWIANTPMLFDGDEFEATPHRFKYSVRDGQGVIRQADEISLAAGQSSRINISNAIADPRTPFTFGTFEISLWSETRGVRGTTRPQIEILGEKSACSVHTSGPHRTAFKFGIAVPCRPDDDRIFIVFMNTFDRELSGTITVGTSAKKHRLGVGAFSTTAFEVPTEGIESDTAFVEWDMDGGCKVYMVCASKELDRFSVDHA